MALTHETKPKMKNNTPMIKIEIRVSRWLNALAWMGGVELFMGVHFHPVMMKERWWSMVDD
jgi:hypothetical protein